MRQVEADYKKMEESRERRKRKMLKQEMKESRKPNVGVKHNEDKRLHEVCFLFISAAQFCCQYLFVGDW